MSSPITVGESDLCKLAAIVTAEREDLPAQGLPPSLLSDLMSQIRCDAVSFYGHDSGRQETGQNPAVSWPRCGDPISRFRPAPSGFPGS